MVVPEESSRKTLIKQLAAFLDATEGRGSLEAAEV